MCGYPRNFELVPRNVRDAYDQIAKGILPPLGDYLGRVAKASLEEGIRVKKPKEPAVIDFTDDARRLGREDPRIPKMDQKYWGIHREWLVRKRDE
jgi:hypothetical protein